MTHAHKTMANQQKHRNYLAHIKINRDGIEINRTSMHDTKRDAQKWIDRKRNQLFDDERIVTVEIQKTQNENNK